MPRMTSASAPPAPNSFLILPTPFSTRNATWQTRPTAKEKGPSEEGPFYDKSDPSRLGDWLYAGRGRALRALLGLVLDLRALFERTVAVALDRAEVNEHVVRAIVG